MEKMTEPIYAMFYLDKKTINFLNEEKKALRLSKSKIIREILRYFAKNKQDLKKIIMENLEG